VPNVIGIIPARFQSKRFPGKPLALLGGVPLIVVVYKAALKSRLMNDLYVATDDPRIESAVKQHGGKVIITRRDHQTGSDRAAEAIENIPDAELIVNIQGDEPFISAEVIDSVIGLLNDSSAVMSTVCAPFSSQQEVGDPNNVKVVLDRDKNAIYFSRSLIPFVRPDSGIKAQFYHHIGIYSFKRDFLEKYTRMERTPLEIAEGLEQLRALEHGYKIRTAITSWDYPGIDSKEDLAKAEALLGVREKQNG